MAREKGKREKEELKEKEKAEKEILTKGKKAPMINLCRSGFAPHACFPRLISKKLLSQGPHFYWIGSFFQLQETSWATPCHYSCDILFSIPHI